METDALFNLITSEHKWYAPHFSHTTAYRIRKQHEQGVYKNYEWFFAKFGYKVSQVKMEWRKAA